MALRHQEDPKIERLHKMEVFQHANKSTLRHVAAVTDELHVNAGQMLIEQGHRFHEAYLIVSGEADVIIEGDVIAQVGPDEMVGELALFNHSSAGASVRAATDMEVLSIPYQQLHGIVHENPDLCFAMAKQLAHRLQNMNQLYELSIHAD